MLPNLRGNLIAVSVTLAVVVVLAFARTPHEEPFSVPSSYDTGRYGYAALYALLQREQFSVRRFERNHYLLREAGVATLVLAQSPFDAIAGEGISNGDALALRDWIRSGGRLIALGPPYGSPVDAKLGIPPSKDLWRPARAALPFADLTPLRGVDSVSGRFQTVFAWDATRKGLPLLAIRDGIVAMQYRFGKGSVVVFNNPSAFENQNLAAAGNARFAVQLFAQVRGPIAFDEAVRGYAHDQTLWAVLPPLARAGVWIAAFGLLLAIVDNAVRFAPPVPAAAELERDSSAYITSMAELLVRARAANRAVRDVAVPVLRAVRRAAGLSEGARLRDVLARVPDATNRAAVLELDRLTSVPEPSTADLLRAGALSAHLRKDYPL